MPIQSGTPIEIQASLGWTVLPWNSEILEVREDCFEIRRPERHSVKLPSRPEGSMKVVIASDNGLYTMSCRIIEEGTRQVCLALPQAEETQLTQRRQHPRHALRPPRSVTLIFDEEWGMEPLVGDLLDFSPAGCRIRVGSALIEGLPVRVAVRDVAGDLGAVAGTIVYFQPQAAGSLVGVRFEADGEVLAKLLEGMKAS